MPVMRPLSSFKVHIFQANDIIRSRSLVESYWTRFVKYQVLGMALGIARLGIQILVSGQRLGARRQLASEMSFEAITLMRRVNSTSHLSELEIYHVSEALNT